MGAAVSAFIPAAATVITGLVSLFRGRRAAPNPVIEAINDQNQRRELEEARRHAEEDAAAARAEQAEAQRAAADLTQRIGDANAAMRRMEEEARRMRDEYTKREREEAARRAQDDAERRAREDASSKVQQEILSKAQEYAQIADNARRAQEAAERKAENAKREAAAAQQAIQKAKETEDEAKKKVDNAEKIFNEERAARAKLEDDLKKGVQPVEWPTKRQLSDAKRNYQYREGIFHFAIAGVAGSGKSSLINALCGYPNNHPSAAKTGIVETTSKVTRYPDPNPANPFAWYDVPGAGTLDIPDWQYFNSQGLYVFDCIIVLFDNRFTVTDVAILKNCHRYNIPSYIVRSKANQHILNFVIDMEGQIDDNEEEEESARRSRAELYPKARDAFIRETRQNVKANLKKAGLPEQRVYVVSNAGMLGVVKGKVPKSFIDEYDLLRDILEEAKMRRLSSAAIR